MKKIFDVFEKWLVDTGLIDQLATLVTKTSNIRALVLCCAGALTAKGLQESSYWESIVGFLVTAVTGSLTAFISHVRDKYAKQIQAVVGAVPDQFIGPQTVAAVRDVTAVATAVTVISDPTPPRTSISEGAVVPVIISLPPTPPPNV